MRHGWWVSRELADQTGLADPAILQGGVRAHLAKRTARGSTT